MKIYERIRKLREIKDLTRIELADHLDVSLSGYSKIEQGCVEITISKLMAIAEYLNVDVRQLIDPNVACIDTLLNFSGNNTSAENKALKKEVNYLNKIIYSLERENSLLRCKIDKGFFKNDDKKEKYQLIKK